MTMEEINYPDPGEWDEYEDGEIEEELEDDLETE